MCSLQDPEGTRPEKLEGGKGRVWSREEQEANGMALDYSEEVGREGGVGFRGAGADVLHFGFFFLV